MKRLLVLLLVGSLTSSAAMGALVWENDCSSLDDWSWASDSGGGVGVSGGDKIQLNSWWDNAKWTNMWRSTGVVIQDEMTYTLTITMQSYASSKDVIVNMQNVTDGWTIIVEETFAPATT